MAAKGSNAKSVIIQKLKDVFGKDYIGEFNSKHYIWSDDGGEKVQIAISLTCPKTQVEVVNTKDIFSDGFDFENTEPAVAAPTSFEPAQITQEEQDNLATIMARLGL
jgi:hypothetical protein